MPSPKVYMNFRYFHYYYYWENDKIHKKVLSISEVQRDDKTNLLLGHFYIKYKFLDRKQEIHYISYRKNTNMFFKSLIKGTGLCGDVYIVAGVYRRRGSLVYQRQKR